VCVLPPSAVILPLKPKQPKSIAGIRLAPPAISPLSFVSLNLIGFLARGRAILVGDVFGLKSFIAIGAGLCVHQRS